MNHIMSREGNDACAWCGRAATHTCSACHSVRFCGRDCQLLHWNAGHKTMCAVIAARATATPTTASGSVITIQAPAAATASATATSTASTTAVRAMDAAAARAATERAAGAGARETTRLSRDTTAVQQQQRFPRYIPEAAAAAAANAPVHSQPRAASPHLSTSTAPSPTIPPPHSTREGKRRLAQARVAGASGSAGDGAGAAGASGGAGGGPGAALPKDVLSLNSAKHLQLPPHVVMSSFIMAGKATGRLPHFDDSVRPYIRHKHLVNGRPQ